MNPPKNSKEAAHNVHIRSLDGRIDHQRMRFFMYDMIDTFLEEVVDTDPYQRWPNLNSLAYDFATQIRCLHNVYEDESAVIAFIRDTTKRKT